MVKRGNVNGAATLGVLRDILRLGFVQATGCGFGDVTFMFSARRRVRFRCRSFVIPVRVVRSTFCEICGREGRRRGLLELGFGGVLRCLFRAGLVNEILDDVCARVCADRMVSTMSGCVSISILGPLGGRLRVFRPVGGRSKSSEGVVDCTRADFTGDGTMRGITRNVCATPVFDSVIGGIGFCCKGRSFIGCHCASGAFSRDERCGCAF